MNVLVTGAAGFVGKHLVKRLKKDGHLVTALVRENTDTAFLDELGIKTVRADLREKASLYGAFENVQAVIHLATTMKGVWQEYEESTVNGTRRLLEIAKEKSVKKFIFISSIIVYDARSSLKEVTESTSLIDEQKATNYEKSKILAEKVVGDFSGSGIATVVLRSGVIYGPGGALFVPRLGFGLGSNRYLIVGNGKNRIPLVYVENLVDAICLALVKDGIGGEAFTIVDDQDIEQDQYLRAVKERVNPSLSIGHMSLSIMSLIGTCVTRLLGLLKRPSPIRSGYLRLCARQITYSNNKVKQLLGWSSPKSSADALRETMEHFQSGHTHHRIVDQRIARGTIELPKPANVALVGCGVIAKTHLDILKRIKGVSVVGVVDTSPEAAAALAKEYGLKNTYGSLNELFEKEKVDVIHVLTPPKGRLEIVETAAKHGCDILIEKPFALNADEAEKIVKVARSKNIKVCVNHNHLFDPPMIEARKLLASGAVGDVLYAESWYGFNLSANLGSRYMMPGAGDHWSMKLPGKLYQNLFSHPFSVLNEVLGDPQEVLAHAYCGRVVKSMKTDELKVYVKTPNSAGLLTVSLAVNPRYQFLNIYGSNMCLYIDFLNKTLIKHSTQKGIPKAISRALMSISAGWILITSTLRNVFKVMTKSFTYYDGTEILIKEFYRRRLTEEPMPVSAEEGLESMRVMDEVWKQVRI